MKIRQCFIKLGYIFASIMMMLSMTWCSIASAENIISFNAETKPEPIGFYMDFIEDSTTELDFDTIRSLPFTENIGHRALIYVEEYALSSNMRSGDAIISSTAVENNMILVSSNIKHFKVVKELQLKTFKP